MQLIRNSDGSSGSCTTALINVCHNTVDRLTRQSAVHEGQTIYAAIGRCFTVGLMPMGYRLYFINVSTTYYILLYLTYNNIFIYSTFW